MRASGLVVLGVLGAVARAGAQDRNDGPKTNGPPGWMIGDFEDDYGNRFRVGATTWITAMAPYRWAFCFTAYRAASRADAINTPPARTTSPRDGCNGYPFSRMKLAEASAEPPR